jgi:hypothetical protein
MILGNGMRNLGMLGAVRAGIYLDYLAERCRTGLCSSLQ